MKIIKKLKCWFKSTSKKNLLIFMFIDLILWLLLLGFLFADLSDADRSVFYSLSGDLLCFLCFSYIWFYEVFHFTFEFVDYIFSKKKSPAAAPADPEVTE